MQTKHDDCWHWRPSMTAPLAARPRAWVGVTVQIVRDWVLRFNAEGSGGLTDRKAPGKAPLLTGEHRAALAAAVEAGPRPYIDGVVRWRLVDLVAWALGRVPDLGQPPDPRS